MVRSKLNRDSYQWISSVLGERIESDEFQQLSSSLQKSIKNMARRWEGFSQGKTTTSMTSWRH